MVSFENALKIVCKCYKLNFQLMWSLDFLKKKIIFFSCWWSAEYLGLPYSPPYLSFEGPKSLSGINYASSSCGILPETGSILVRVFFDYFCFSIFNQLILNYLCFPILVRLETKTVFLFFLCIYLIWKF